MDVSEPQGVNGLFEVVPCGLGYHLLELVGDVNFMLVLPECGLVLPSWAAEFGWVARLAFDSLE